ncbi:MAG: phytanoyl-CoA dioxygenase family protein [Minicystis sp.]
MQAGGVVFHHGKTLHCSHANNSDRWRRAYATHWVTANVTTPTTRLDNAYFKKKWALLPGRRPSP